MKQYGLIDEFRWLRRLSELGDPLKKVSSFVDFEQFRPLLNKVFYRKDYGQGGRPSYDCVMMFKVLLLQSFYDMVDDKAEYIIMIVYLFSVFWVLHLVIKCLMLHTSVNYTCY